MAKPEKKVMKKLKDNHNIPKIGSKQKTPHAHKTSISPIATKPKKEKFDTLRKVSPIIVKKKLGKKTKSKTPTKAKK